MGFISECTNNLTWEKKVKKNIFNNIYSQEFDGISSNKKYIENKNINNLIDNILINIGFFNINKKD